MASPGLRRRHTSTASSARSWPGCLPFHGGGHGKQEAFGLHLLGIEAGALPEGRRLVVEDVDVDHPVKVLQRLPDLIGIREAARGVLAHTGEALDLARIHGVDHAHDRGVLPVVELRQIVVTKAVFRRPAFGIEGPHQAGGVLAGIAHPVQGLRVRRLGRGARDVLLQRLPRSLGSLEVAGQIMRQQAWYDKDPPQVPRCQKVRHPDLYQGAGGSPGCDGRHCRHPLPRQQAPHPGF